MLSRAARTDQIRDRQVRYLERVATDRSFAVKESRALANARLAEWLSQSSGNRVLELGCGPGKYVSMLAALGMDVVGVDPFRFPEWDSLSSKLPVQLFDGIRAEHLPFDNESFDAVACLGALLYFDDPEQALAEIRRVLRPGGRLLLRTVNRGNLYTRCTGRRLDPASKHLYTRTELESLVRCGGFIIDRSFADGFWPPAFTDFWWYLQNVWLPAWFPDLLGAALPPDWRVRLVIWATRPVSVEPHTSAVATEARPEPAHAGADLAVQVIAHHLRLFGWPDHGIEAGLDPRVRVVTSTDAQSVSTIDVFARQRGVTVVLRPPPDLCHAFGIEVSRGLASDDGTTLVPAMQDRDEHFVLRTLHRYSTFSGGGAERIVSDPDGRAVWAWLSLGAGGVLLVGSDLASDLIRFRQGDPGRAADRTSSGIWGFGHERPVFLFEAQLCGLSPYARPADNWMELLVSTLSQRSGQAPRQLLPGGAPGAIVITGDDDQAYLDSYTQQLALLHDAPITYFLHPRTRHSQETLRGLAERPDTDIQLHADALDEPAAYSRLLTEQAYWFERFVGRRATGVRNHGYLNDGYWGHLEAWLREGLQFSSNLPGLNGRVLNGSLLPARLATSGHLTEHWSIVTAIGDGIVFIDGADEQQSGAVVQRAIDRIRAASTPGVLVVNLHPQNVARTRQMHLLARGAIETGFVGWTMADCIDWFARRDRPVILNHCREAANVRC